MAFHQVRGAISSILAVALAIQAGVARAEGGDDRARSLFKEGRELASAGRYDAACPKFEESRRLFDGPGTQFNLADCWEHVGKLASARALFLEVATATHALGQSDREHAARARADALDAQVSHLVLRVADHTEGLALHLNGSSVTLEAQSAPVAVDPGDVLVEATAPERESWKTSVAIPKEPATIIVEVPRLEAAPSPPPASTDDAARSKPEMSTGATVATSHRVTGLERIGSRTTRNLLAGAVAVGAVTAGISWVLFQNKNTRAEGVCPNSTGCSADEIDRHQDLVSGARTARTVGFVGVGLATAAVTTGVVLYLIGPRRSDDSNADAQAWTVGVGAGPVAGALFARRRF